MKEALCKVVLDAGFIRVRILAPFQPPAPDTMAERFRAGAPSLLVAALPYGNEAGEVSVPRGVVPAYIAPFARKNYYREAVTRLQRCAVLFRSRYGGVRSDYRILCNSPVPEKPLALAAGLGVLGRNGLIMTPEAGSLVILAAMTVPFPLESDRPLPASSSGCDCCATCVAACPTGALQGDGTLDRKRCIQWYASGHGGERVPEEVAAKWGQTLYGCTACQDACVHSPIRGVECATGHLPDYFDCRYLLDLPDEAVGALFKGSALGQAWLTPAQLKRNARLALRFSQDRLAGKEGRD